MEESDYEIEQEGEWEQGEKPIEESEGESEGAITKILHKAEKVERDKEESNRRTRIINPPINVPVVTPQISPSLTSGQIYHQSFQQHQQQQQFTDPRYMQMIQEQKRLENEARVARARQKVAQGFNVKSNMGNTMDRFQKIDMVNAQPRINVNNVLQQPKNKKRKK